MENKMPSNIFELIQATYYEYNIMNSSDTYANCLIKVLKKYHLWPIIQVKKFKNNNDMVLVHSLYNREDAEKFKELYNQCRSIVLDFSQNDNYVVVSYSNNIPTRINAEDYSKMSYENHKYQEAFDGTMITVYYNNKEQCWNFGTSSCPEINYSKFQHPNKSHGYMVDEVLMTYFRQHFTDNELSNTDQQSITQISQKLRHMFTSYLDPNIAYEFVLVHHENIHIIDYTNILGQGYKYLYHINSKNRHTLSESDISNKPLESIGIKYPKVFQTFLEAYSYMNQENFNNYGIIVKQFGDNTNYKLLKISPSYIDIREETDPCNPNVWHNILMVYMKNRKDYKINDYIKLYAPNLQFPYDDKGRQIDATYLIHTMISTLKDVLYKLYISTTTYNPKTNRFKMNKELDKQFPPVIRFHLAQLRHRQQNESYKSLLRPKDIYYYICHCNNVKNIKLLITLFATNIGYDIPERSALCLTVLNSLL